MASGAASVAAADALAAAALELERARMRLNDVESYMAQRHWVNSQQVPETGRPMTWESMFCLRHNDFIDAHDALEQIRDLLNENDAQAALEVALDVVGHAEEPPSAEPSEQSSQEAESSEQSSQVDSNPELPAYVQDMQEQLLEAVQLPAPAAELLPFSGRCFRLDDA